VTSEGSLFGTVSDELFVDSSEVSLFKTVSCASELFVDSSPDIFGQIDKNVDSEFKRK